MKIPAIVLDCDAVECNKSISCAPSNQVLHCEATKGKL